MRKFLLLSAASLLATIEVSAGLPQQAATDVAAGKARVLKSSSVVTTPLTVTKVDPFLRQVRSSRANASSDVVLFEDFEGSDGTNEWLPAGWERISKSPEQLSIPEIWWVSNQSNVISFASGYYALIDYSSEQKEQDEWLCTPTVTVPENACLSFDYWYQPTYIFDCFDHIDENSNFTEKVVVTDLQVMIQVDGGEWTKIFSIADELDYVTNVRELAALMQTAMYYEMIDLTDYSGKSVRLAFRYIGNDGEKILFDNVRVGLAPAEPFCYVPWSTLYWGMTTDELWSLAMYPCAFFPAYEDLMWMNNDDIPDASYTWTYPVSGSPSETATSNDVDLVVSFAPDFTNDATAQNSIYPMPTLGVSAPGYTDAVYTPVVEQFQVGGKPSFTYDDIEYNFGLLPSPLHTSRCDIFVADPVDDGKPAIPVFGKSDDTNEWWKNRASSGEPTGDFDCKVIGFMNVQYTTVSPLVMNGLYVQAKGQLKEGASFKAEIIPLNSQMEFDYSAKRIATAECSYNDIIIMPGGVQDYLTLHFSFDEPLGISSADCPAFMILITGMDSDEVIWFAPEQSYAVEEICHGFILRDITSNSTHRYDVMGIGYMDNEYGDPMFNSFLIHIDGYYPYFKISDNTIELNADRQAAFVDVVSSFDPKEVTVFSPEGISAKLTGRYDKAKLTVKADDGADDGEREILIEAPGFTTTVKVNVTGLGSVDGVSVDNDADAVVVGRYTPDGRCVDAAADVKGLFIERLSNGQTRKVFVK